MIINWIAAKVQQFLPEQESGLDEFNASFDFALSAEIVDLLYAQNATVQQAEAVMTQFALDEHELALA